MPGLCRKSQPRHTPACRTYAHDFWILCDTRQHQHYDPDYQPSAGIPPLHRTIINRGGRYEDITIAGNTAEFIERIDEALARFAAQGVK